MRAYGDKFSSYEATLPLVPFYLIYSVVYLTSFSVALFLSIAEDLEPDFLLTEFMTRLTRSFN